jgi:hypothetical protein
VSTCTSSALGTKTVNTKTIDRRSRPQAGNEAAVLGVLVDVTTKLSVNGEPVDTSKSQTITLKDSIFRCPVCVLNNSDDDRRFQLDGQNNCST